jgi:hypothetical protein
VSTHAVSGPAPATCRALTQRVLLGGHIWMLLSTRRECPSTHATVRTFAIEMRMRQPPENALVGHVFCSSKNCSGNKHAKRGDAHATHDSPMTISCTAAGASAAPKHRCPMLRAAQGRS